MSKILCVGDIHLSHTRLNLCEQVLNWIAEVIRDLKPDGVVYLGDEFDTHAVIRAECLGIWTNHLNKTLKYCPTYWLLGNHAMYKPNDSKYNALIPFMGWKMRYLNIVTSSTEIDGFGFVPYLCHGQTWEDETKDFKSDIVFTHNTFVGADFGFKLATEGVSQAEIAQSLVISGHIHKRQILTYNESGCSVCYPGTPYSWSGHDVDEKKGLMLFDSETRQFEFIESPFPMWRRLEVDLTSCNEILVPDTIKYNDHLLLSIKGLRSDVRTFLSSSHLKDLRESYSSVSVSTTFLDSAKVAKSISSIKSKTISDILETYMSTVYKGSSPVEEVKDAVLNAIGNEQ